MNPRYAQVAARAGHRCEYCHAPESLFNFAFEVEHVTPAAAGGSDAEFNLALSCRSCNVHKSNRTRAPDPESLTEVPLFDPRAACWDDHFGVDTETGRILGLTASGRATVAALALNSESQRAARGQWTRMGLFP